MTREEAVEFGNMWLQINEDCKDSSTYAFFLIAIKALEQEPCDNAVSRQDVLDLAKKGILVSNGNYESVCKAINALPSVTPQPKTGHWILTSDNDCEYCTCSECGYQNGENWMIGSVIKFCQECGAKMVEPQERSEKK